MRRFQSSTYTDSVNVPYFMELGNLIKCACQFFTQGCTYVAKSQQPPQNSSAKTVRIIKIHTENPQIPGTTVKTLVGKASWCIGFMHLRPHPKIQSFLRRITLRPILKLLSFLSLPTRLRLPFYKIMQPILIYLPTYDQPNN
jgi:hypothetical protein